MFYIKRIKVSQTIFNTHLKQVNYSALKIIIIQSKTKYNEISGDVVSSSTYRWHHILKVVWIQHKSKKKSSNVNTELKQMKRNISMRKVISQVIVITVSK